jgi:hypothetical protein
MWRRIGTLVLLLLIPGVVPAQEPPEDLLSAGTQVYLRWDGVSPHQAAYNRSALGKMLKGDTGRFVAGVFSQLQDLLGGAVVQELLKGTPPEKLQKIQEDAARAPKLVSALGKHGFILAAEVRGVVPPDAQVTLILPDAADSAGSFIATLRLAATLTREEVKERKLEGRTIYQLARAPIPVAWWVEGKHILFTAGTSLPETVIKHITDRKNRLNDNPLFRKVSGFKAFETGTRAFVDVASLVHLAKTVHPGVDRVLAASGAADIKSLIFYSGFDGAAEHGLTEVELSGSRTGLLRLLAGKPFRLADVPPLPSDAINWSMTNFDLTVAYDEGIKTAEAVLAVAAPGDLAKFKEAVNQLDDNLGVSLRKDILAALGDQVVSYNSPTDGALFFGQTLLFKVKDPARLEAALAQAIKGIARTTGLDISTKKRSYHGATLHEVHVRQQGFIFLPTYSIHKGWLAVSYFPQAVQSFVLRADGHLPAWKPDRRTREAFAKLPKDVIAVSVSDPRPIVKQVLSITPFVGAAINSSLPESKFDVGLIPNGHEATRYLFPNVSVTTIDDHTLRLETRASLALPLELTNTDALVVLGALSSLRFVLP